MLQKIEFGVLCVCTDWDDNQYNRLALYISGDLEQLPLRSGLDDQKIVRKTSTEVRLQEPLSSSINIWFGVTKARLHASSSSFVYPALSGHLIPSEWTHYESRIEGEAFAINNSKFRPGTVSARIGFLANHGQKGKEVEMVVKNFTFSLIKYSLKWNITVNSVLFVPTPLWGGRNYIIKWVLFC